MTRRVVECIAFVMIAVVVCAVAAVVAEFLKGLHAP